MDYRDLFDGIDEKIKLSNGVYTTPINFDNGATTPPLKTVTQIIYDNIKNYGPIARGVGFKGEYCTMMFNQARDIILDFFGLGDNDDYTIIYTKSDTEGLNVLANVLVQEKDDMILTTRMEHHANDLPFRRVGKMVYVEVDHLGRINIDDIEDELIKANGKIKIVTVTGASNVTGYTTPIHDIARLAHKYGALIIVDAAQLVSHKKINMNGGSKEEEIDFLTFSAHKAYAPFGSGAIVGKKDYLNEEDPFLSGGGCVAGVFDDRLIWTAVPEKYEAGTQNFFGAIAMARALADLKNIGFENIENHERELKNYIIQGLKSINNIIMYGDVDYTEDRIGVIPFNIKNRDYSEVSIMMATEKGISLRSGKFCAHTYVYRLMGASDSDAYRDVVSGEYFYGMIRASLGLYNTIDEANIFLNEVEFIANNRNTRRHRKHTGRIRF
ncbi:aminotransferase class V-fold PLP-dependent enzyme [Intestinibacter bartlettii]|uniref:Aminotransferase class V-fold PLP-dependent enzyme n=1 Tax=Intestinibacter bartlettii TaxID=261299 RepID=A0ABS6DWT8_9FIRM|nr:aminotransferase class V-fold PLP-dependent enzyme [Intestinibacter bartlettii]MBU5336292.1 aminotransferase class V-fold PLP-dependent enzyme [Intestinibacter bartlettii]MDO5010103.1 aminotransferase class V-fold PLP-dependent enzyme [Intestinibacter bartlettii]